MLRVAPPPAVPRFVTLDKAIGPPMSTSFVIDVERLKSEEKENMHGQRGLDS